MSGVEQPISGLDFAGFTLVFCLPFVVSLNIVEDIGVVQRLANCREADPSLRLG